MNPAIQALLLAAAAADPSPPDLRDADELRVWRDPAFRRQVLAAYAPVTDVEPRVTELERAQMEKIVAAMGVRDGLGAARKMLEQAATPAASAVFDFMLGHACFQQNEMERAAEHYQRAVAKHPSFLRAHKQMGVVHVRAGRPEQAIPSLTRAIELGGGDGLTYGLLGFALMQTERHVSAESAYRMASLLQPEVVDWRLGLARCLFKQGRFADAVALCDELIRIEPNRPEYRLLQANAYLGGKQPAKAAALYELLDLMGAATADALNTLGDIHVNDGCFDLAAEAYGRALEKDGPERLARHIRNAEVLAARGAHSEAEQVSARIRDVGGDQLDSAARKRLLKLAARAAAARGAAAQEQVKILEEVVAIDPLDGEALILLGQHAASAGEMEKAALLFERAAAIETSEAEARLRHAQALVRAGRYADALPLLKRAQELRPREDVARYQEQVERMARVNRR